MHSLTCENNWGQIHLRILKIENMFE
jgi:hypothetical protein